MVGQTSCSGLFVVTKLEPKERLEDELESFGTFVRQLVVQPPDQPGKSNQEIHDILTSTANANSENHEKVCLGLFYLILMDADSSNRAFQDLALITRDHFGSILAKLNVIIMEFYFRLTDTAREQLVWFVNQLVKSRCIGANQCCICLMKNIVGGDVSAKNVWLADKLLDIFIENKMTLLYETDSFILGIFLYTYLRLICDHRGTNRFESLRQKEIKFCVSLLRDKFMDCCIIGRDLLRLLQNVATIPDFQTLWRDILYQPHLLSPKFNGMLNLLQTRSQRKFIAARLTPEMENKLNFLMSKVKFGNQKRYQDWFHKSYLSTAESQNLCPDLIRYICCVIHPTNEILCSEVIPRWAVIGWLLLQCKSNSIAAECKLALFFDWLTFQLDKDNIMNIEPAILVMYHNLKHHPATSITLLDFLCRIQTQFYPPLEQAIKQGVHNSFKLVLEKRVLPSLTPIFESNKLDADLKSLIKTSFGDFLEVPLPGPGGILNLPPPPPTDHTKVAEALLEEIGPSSNQSLLQTSRGAVDPGSSPSGGVSYDSGLDSGPECGASGRIGGSGNQEGFSSDEELEELRPPPVIVDDDELEQKPQVNPSSVAGAISLANDAQSVGQSGVTSSPVGVGIGAGLAGSAAVGGGGGDNLWNKSTKDLIVYPIIEPLECEDITKYFSQLDTVILQHVQTLLKNNTVATDSETACDLICKICEVQISYQTTSRESCVPLAACLCTLLISNFPVPLLTPSNNISQPGGTISSSGIGGGLFSPVTGSLLNGNNKQHKTNSSSSSSEGNQQTTRQSVTERIAELLRNPLYTIFKVLAQSETDALSLSYMVAEMYELNQRVGYHLLFFLSEAEGIQSAGGTSSNDKAMTSSDSSNNSNLIATSADFDSKQVYVDVMLNALDEEICTALVKDMHLAAKHDMKLFLRLLPYVFQNFTDEVTGNIPMIRLIVSCIDPEQLNVIISEILLDEIKLFDEETLLPILVDSLQWESYEQTFLWQLIAAHEISCECLIPLIHKLNWCQHPEACTAITLRLKREKPNFQILKHIYSHHSGNNSSVGNVPTSASTSGSQQPAEGERDEKEDMLCVSLLYYWSVTCSPLLADLTKRLITGTSNTATAKSGQGRNAANAASPHRNPTLTEILRHLDKLRLNVDYKNDDFFSQDSVIDALKFAHTHIYKSQRDNFQDLFGLVNLSSPPGSPHRRVSSRNTNTGGSSGSSSSAGSGSKENSTSSKSPRAKRAKRESSIEISSSDSESNDEDSSSSIGSSRRVSSRTSSTNGTTSSTSRNAQRKRSTSRRRGNNSTDSKNSSIRKSSRSSSSQSDDDSSA